MASYYITEHATYTVEAESPKAALQKFLGNIRYPFGCDVDYRDVCTEDGDDVTEVAEDV